MRKTSFVVGGVLALLASACGSGTPTGPSSSVIVTFAVANEMFRVRLSTSEQIAEAQLGQHAGLARIPTGRIVHGTDVNTGWTWHLEGFQFAEVTIELCDGRPSDVQREGTGFGGGRFCPWTARVVRIDEG